MNVPPSAPSATAVDPSFASTLGPRPGTDGGINYGNESDAWRPLDDSPGAAWGWGTDQCCEWLERIGLQQLQQCFRGNFMKGKWLLQLSSKSLLSMNIQNYQDIRLIMTEVRALRRQVLDSGEDVPELLRREWELDETGKSRMC